MVDSEVRELIEELSSDYGHDYVVFENPSFDRSIIGVTEDGEHLIYNYDLMVEEFCEDNEVDEEEAIEFIDYNTIRSLEYQNDLYKPIIMRGIVQEILYEQ